MNAINLKQLAANMNKIFKDLSGHMFLKQPYLELGVAFQFSQVTITMTVYAMAMLFKKKISVHQCFLCSEFVLFSWPQFQECEAKICQFLVNCVICCFFVTTLSPRNNNYGTGKIS